MAFEGPDIEGEDIHSTLREGTPSHGLDLTLSMVGSVQFQFATAELVGTIIDQLLSVIDEAATAGS